MAQLSVSLLVEGVEVYLEGAPFGLLLEDHRGIGLGNLAQMGLVLGPRPRGIRLRRYNPHLLHPYRKDQGKDLSLIHI